jgi:hypothetical protein
MPLQLGFNGGEVEDISHALQLLQTTANLVLVALQKRQ